MPKKQQALVPTLSGQEAEAAFSAWLADQKDPAAAIVELVETAGGRYTNGKVKIDREIIDIYALTGVVFNASTYDNCKALADIHSRDGAVPISWLDNYILPSLGRYMALSESYADFNFRSDFDDFVLCFLADVANDTKRNDKIDKIVEAAALKGEEGLRTLGGFVALFEVHALTREGYGCPNARALVDTSKLLSRFAEAAAESVSSISKDAFIAGQKKTLEGESEVLNDSFGDGQDDACATIHAYKALLPRLSISSIKLIFEMPYLQMGGLGYFEFNSSDLFLMGLNKLTTSIDSVEPKLLDKIVKNIQESLPFLRYENLKGFFNGEPEYITKKEFGEKGIPENLYERARSIIRSNKKLHALVFPNVSAFVKQNDSVFSRRLAGQLSKPRKGSYKPKNCPLYQRPRMSKYATPIGHGW